MYINVLYDRATKRNLTQRGSKLEVSSFLVPIDIREIFLKHHPNSRVHFHGCHQRSMEERRRSTFDIIGSRSSSWQKLPSGKRIIAPWYAPIPHLRGCRPVMMFAFVRELSSKLNIEAKEGGRHRGKGMLKRNPESKGGGMGKGGLSCTCSFPGPLW